MKKRSAEINDQFRIECWIFIDPVFGVTAWVANHAGPVRNIIKAVMGMAVNPQRDALTVQQMLHIGYEAGVERQIREPGMDAAGRWGMVGDDYGRSWKRRGQARFEPGDVAAE